MIDTKLLTILNAIKGARLIFHPTNGYKAMGIPMAIGREEMTALLTQGFIRSVGGVGGVYELTTSGLNQLNLFDPRVRAQEIQFCCQCHQAKPSQYQGKKNGRHWWVCALCSLQGNENE